nr:MAG TPA: hypothetical protein [Caudoviricetes sp.]
MSRLSQYLSQNQHYLFLPHSTCDNTVHRPFDTVRR